MRHSRGVADTLTAVAGLWKTPSAQEPGVSGARLVNADGTQWTGGQRAYDLETGRLAQTGIGQMVDNWQTPVSDDALDRKVGKINSRGEPKLSGQAHLWPTPMAGTPAQNGNAAAGNSDFSRKAEELARGLWTTPQAHDVTPRGSGQKPTAKAGNACLATDAQQWPTPQARDFRSGDNPDSPRQARKMEQGWSQNLNDVAEASTWPTPAARDHKGENGQDHLTNGTGRLHMDQLPNAVAHGFSHPAPAIETHGGRSSLTARSLRPLLRLMKSSATPAGYPAILRGHSKPRLNPNFVSWLMGWPIGHGLCACSATAWSAWSQHMRSALSRLPTASGPWIWKPTIKTDAPMQADLFGGS